MKSKPLIFKTMLLTLSLAHLLTLCAGQEAVDLKLLTFPKDSTYQFCEVQTKDGDTIAINFFPQQRLKKAAFVEYAYGMAQRFKERKQEQERLAKMAQKNINFFAAQMDSVGGAGSYAALEHNQLKQKLQGAWSLVARTGDGKEPEVTTIVIQDSTMQSKDKQSAITWTNGETFSIAKGLFTFTLAFKLAEPDRYVAEKNGVKYILKR